MEDLLCYNKETWCRAYFKTDVSSDVCENNMCETFNSWILVPRFKSIISMLEEIRRKVMERISNMRAFAQTWISDISPMARHRLEQNKLDSMNCQLLWNGESGFEVSDGKYRHTVDVRKKKCTCRSWELKGIPCAHAISAMHHLGMNPDDHIVCWYKKEMYLKAYAHPIQPVLNMKMFPESSHAPIQPPKVVRMPGRPKLSRRKDKDEPKKNKPYGKISKKGARMTCSLCRNEGHNKNGCPRKMDFQNQVYMTLLI